MNVYKWPCKECTERYPACHDSCERYLAVKAKNQAIEDKLRKDKDAYAHTIEHVLKNSNYVAQNRKKGRFTYGKGE